MAGIYIHIPFCAQACHYCDFHFSTNQKNKAEMVDMLCREIALRAGYLASPKIDSLYFGGGTPSVLAPEELRQIMDTVNQYFRLSEGAEVTLEANPDDLNEERLRFMYASGINRLSIGIQTFDEQQLRYLNRVHNAGEALQCVQTAQKAGFDNISIDLIYGIPSPDHTIWQNDLKQALALGVQHISSYCLTIEPSTVFGRRLAKGLIAGENEEYNAQQFEILIETLEANGFEQYEVSNFCRPDLHARHNSSYWQGTHYLGIGPGAHSFDGKSRQYNIENNVKYIKALAENTLSFSIEELDLKTQANEYIMTGLRTKWGISCSLLYSKFGVPFNSYKTTTDYYHRLGYLEYDDAIIKLTKKGFLIADKITEDLFII
jgi:oxygen-independent coproporphyrinogen-3 oxidase